MTIETKVSQPNSDFEKEADAIFEEYGGLISSLANLRERGEPDYRFVSCHLQLNKMFHNVIHGTNGIIKEKSESSEERVNRCLNFFIRNGATLKYDSYDNVFYIDFGQELVDKLQSRLRIMKNKNDPNWDPF